MIFWSTWWSKDPYLVNLKSYKFLAGNPLRFRNQERENVRNHANNRCYFNYSELKYFIDFTGATSRRNGMRIFVNHNTRTIWNQIFPLNIFLILPWLPNLFAARQAHSSGSAICHLARNCCGRSCDPGRVFLLVDRVGGVFYRWLPMAGFGIYVSLWRRSVFQNRPSNIRWICAWWTVGSNTYREKANRWS